MSEEIKNIEAEVSTEGFDQLDPDDLDAVSGGLESTDQPKTCVTGYCGGSYTTSAISLTEL
jgi:hypothetical protein